MGKLINMATGGLMSKPPYLNTKEEKDIGITPYDVDSPESARKGMPSRLLSKQRTRFSKGDMAKGPEIVPSVDSWEDATDDSDVIHLVKLNKLEERTYKILKAGKN